MPHRSSTKWTWNRSLAGALVLGVGMAVFGMSPLDVAHAAKADKERSEKFLGEAREYIEKGDANAAVIQLKNALQADPDNIAARVLLGTVYLRVGNGASAEKEFANALRRGAKDQRIRVFLAQALLAQGKSEEALAKLAEEVSDPAAKTDALIVRGRALLNLKRYDEARKALLEAHEIRSDKNDERAKLNIAQTYVSEGKVKEGEAEVDEALAINPKSVEALVLKGELRRVNKELEGAIGYFDKAIAANERHLLGRIGRAATLIDMGQDSKAQADLDAVFRRSPKHPLASYLQALILSKKSDYAGAQEALGQAGHYLDNHMPSVFLRGAIHYALNQYEQAVVNLQRYVEEVPDSERAKKLLGATLLRKRDARRAIEVLGPLVKEDSTDVQLLTLLGSAYMQIGRFNEGTKYFSRASEASPNTASIRMQMALGNLAQGQADAAVGQLQSAIDLDPDARQAAVLLTLVKLRQRDYDGALEAAQALQKKIPDNPLAENLIGAAYLGKGDRAKARETFEAALKKKADFFPARMNLAQLSIQEGHIEEARKQYRTILDQDAKNLGAMLAMSDLAAREQKSDAVVSWLRRAKDANPESLEPSMRLIRHYGRTGDFEKAVSVARELALAHPDNPRVLEVQGRTERAAGDPLAAVQTYKRLSALNPNSAAVLGLVAGAQVAADNPDGARLTLKDAIRLDQDYLPAKVALIELESREKNYDVALALAAELKKAHPDAHYGDMLTGDVLMRQKKFADATAAYERAIVKQDNATLAIRRFTGRRQSGDLDKALSELQSWVDGKNDRDARHILASAYLTSGRYDDALRESERLLSSDADNPVLLNNLAWLYQQRKDGRAVDYAERAYKVAPKSAAVLDTLGWILVDENRDVQRGVDLLARAHASAPQNAEIHYHYAVALNQSGDTAGARQQLQKLIGTGIKFPAVEKAKALLEKLGG